MGARQPSKAAHLTLLKLKPQPAHSREMERVMDLDKNLAFVSDGATAPLEGERIHDTC